MIHSGSAGENRMDSPVDHERCGAGCGRMRRRSELHLARLRQRWRDARLHLPGSDDLATLDRVVAAGVSYAAPFADGFGRGRWPEPLPRVVCRTTGELTTSQWH